MSRYRLLSTRIGATIALVTPSFVAQATNVFAQAHKTELDFGATGKLYSVVRANGETERQFLLRKRSLVGDHGFYIEGSIRQVLEIPGGGYSNNQEQFHVVCSHESERLSVQFGADGDQNKRAIVIAANKPPNRQSQRHAYNLWWAACKNQFQKYK